MLSSISCIVTNLKKSDIVLHSTHLVVTESINKPHMERAQAYQTVQAVHVFGLHQYLLSGL